jgi:hypothetical protein
MKPQDFGEKEAADSMRAAASRLGVPLEVVKQCKRQGSRAFRGGRVYLRALMETIANGETETETVLFPVPTGPGASSKTVSEFRELLRVAIRSGLLRPSEIFEILVEQVIERLDASSPTIISSPKREAVKVFDKVTVAIHESFGIATALLDNDAADEFLRRSAAAFERARKKLFQSHSVRRACK